MTALACTQPGCGGTIEDGYCNVCGLASAPPRVGAGSGNSIPGISIPGISVSGSAGTGSRPGTRGSRPGSGRSARGRLGAGLVEVPSVFALDPAAAILADPRVPENKRICGTCDRLVGQSRDDRPGMTEGFCPHCGTRFSFTPKLEPGELVAGQYEVLGCLAHGGLGWIYLARDHALGGRPVVLKGLLNSGDPDAMEAAVAERQFLSQLDHPNIVKVHNFVQHTSRRDGETAGYIVMEYVGGKTLRQIRLEARQRGTAVPVAHALAYALEILPALGYLHDRGLVYCDFKPDNVIQSEEQLKLIDMGGVRSIEGDGISWGTPGYQAPEIETEGPSPSSDLYTVGRALAVLTFDFVGFTGEYRYRLPADQPLLARQESFARLLRRATHADSKRRFQSAGEMAEQLTGVLREVLSVEDGKPRPAFSGIFSPELRAAGTELAAADPADWRIAWYTGLCELARSRPDRAVAAFDAVYDELPGELAPKLALGFAAEAVGDLAAARRYFQVVAVTDRSFVSAAFGMARACLAVGDRVGAIAAVAAVPEESSHHAAAQIAAIRLLVGGGDGVSAADLRQADGRLGVLSLDDLRREQLTVEILRAALDWVAAAPPGARRHGGNPAGAAGSAGVGAERILGCEPNERALRFGLERGYRALAVLIPDQARKIELVDMANSIRPRTWT